jgi:hypothetical protein
MKFGKGFQFFDNFLFGLGRWNDIEDMPAPRTADFDARRLNQRIVQIELGQTGSAGDDHWNPL